MNTSWHIRKAVQDDSAGLQECMQSAYSAYAERLSGTRLPPMDLDYSAEITGFPTWVIESDGTIVGGLTMIFDGEKASVANISIRPENQGQGLGGELMSFAEVQARERGHADLYLATHALLTENVSLYRHLGWSEIERDENRVRMKKNI